MHQLSVYLFVDNGIVYALFIISNLLRYMRYILANDFLPICLENNNTS